MKLYRTLLLIFFGFISIQTFAKAGDIPVENFFKNPEFSGLTLSPDASQIAVIATINNHRNIVLLDTATLRKARPLTSFDDVSVGGFFWANDNTIVFTLDSSGGQEAFSIYKVTTGKRPKVGLLVGATFGTSGVRSAGIVNTLPDDPDHIIVQYNGRRAQSPDLFRLPLDSRWNSKRNKNTKMKRLEKNPGNVVAWIVDNDGNVRGASALDGVESTFYYKDIGDKEFRILRQQNALDESITPVGFDFDNKTFYVLSNIGRDKNAVYTYDLVNNKLGDLIFGVDHVDVQGLSFSRKRNKLLGVSYFDDYPRIEYFDEEEQKLAKRLQAAFPEKRVSFTSRSEDEMINIVAVTSDTDPGQYYLYDRNKNQLRWLIPAYASLEPKLMSPMKPIKFESRDGLTIHGYVTIPKESDGKKLPLIVNPHGGPFGVRDFWGFNQEHQFFASRGYATVQVNFRGSGGYGRNFEQAGYGGKWGAEMQHDITDVVKYLVDEGIADPERVCIYGASYGGYATMAGLTFTPDLYKCGINYVGVTDVAMLFDTMPKAWESARELLKIQIGDPEDKELMHRMSPLSHVDKIKAPLMIVQGAKDPRVVKAHATELRDALEARGVKLSDDEWIMKQDEGHGFRNEKNKFELYKKIEKFLAKNL